ncbi:MAG: lipopolysaccharide kinase InaA family protein [Pseudomonadales bacterium]|nr:lipopolysaccharide kinase InaA family protein [Pseudomonadales bacterium]MDP6469529.1 lipopolysaccharide kinase InaA family protein [Pseudomonadales bacterium]MDP6827370.1 lipopolysaccharide kinase InaA family protein [Pseudomonadales bacterium]MDP6971193.1 lipopolysaccharide kinase InaA family protein [Pseudomonadales bacterium]
MTLLDAEAVAALGRNLPASIEIPVDGGRFEGGEVLRMLPGRRLVLGGRFQDRTAVMKVFVGRNARRYYERERQGLGILSAAGVPVPEAFWQGSVPARGWGMINAWVEDSRPLGDEDWEQAPVLAAVLAVLHDAGATHEDPHLGNFLVAPRGVVCVDGDGVRRGAGRVTETGGLANLARMIAQYPPRPDQDLTGVLHTYERKRGWGVNEDRLQRLTRHLSAARRERTERYLDKTLRDCTEFAERRVKGSWHIHRRDAASADLISFLEDPDAWLADESLLKDGNSATVYRTRMAERSVIVKRYNIKGFVHRVRRWIKPRARIAWRNGHRLAFLRIPTSTPIALVEERTGPLRGRSWIVMEDCGDEDLLGVVNLGGWQKNWLDQVARILITFRVLGLSHGDMKASNFLILDGLVSIVDLDALAEAPERCERDIERLIANWEGQPRLLEPLMDTLRMHGLLETTH